MHFEANFLAQSMKQPQNGRKIGPVPVPIAERQASQTNEARVGCGLGLSAGCGSCRDDPTEISLDALDNRRQTSPPPEFSTGESYDNHTPGLPAIYTAAEAQPLLGEVLRRGQAWMLSEADGGAEEVERGEIWLYANGFCFKHDGQTWGTEDQGLEVLLVPFAFVRPVAMQSSALQAAISTTCHAKILAITLYLEGRTHFFGFTGRDEEKAQDLCSAWVRDISRSIRWVTESLFTRGSCFQTLLASPEEEDSEHTGRLMAGYLLFSDPVGTIRMVYVEVHPPGDGKARIALYDDTRHTSALCQEALLDARTACYEKVGYDCSCFCVGALQLSARTVFERQLWLRAVSNLKVKLQNRGARPGPEELSKWREAINEHIRENGAKLQNRFHLSDHRATSAARHCADGPEGLALAHTAEKLRGTPLLRRCAPQLVRPAGDSDLPRPESRLVPNSSLSPAKAPGPVSDAGGTPGSRQKF